MKRMLLGLVLLSSVSGCASAYTGIHKNEDGSYYMTRIKAGFFRVYGSLMHCTLAGQVLNCTEIDSP